MNPDDYLPNEPSWLRSSTIFLARHGSHAYGTSTPTSDLDIKGLAIPPPKYYLGFLNHFEQVVTKEPADLTVYELTKFMRLAADCNPSVIEVLFVDESDILLSSSASDVLRANRDLFLSTKAKHTFSGYAISQLKRIQTHRRWLINPPSAAPERKDFGLAGGKVMKTDDLKAAEAAIRKMVDSWGLDLSMVTDESARIHLLGQLNRVIDERTSTTAEDQAANLLGFDTNMTEYLKRERQWATAQREWAQYNEWKATRNVARAELEAKYGYDTKHAMHLVRLMRMCGEILSTGRVIVKRPDAEELLAIRGGAWDYDQLIEWASHEDERLNELMKTSPLPRSLNRVALDKLCVQLVCTYSLDKAHCLY